MSTANCQMGDTQMALKVVGKCKLTEIQKTMLYKEIRKEKGPIETLPHDGRDALAIKDVQRLMEEIRTDTMPTLLGANPNSLPGTHPRPVDRNVCQHPRPVPRAARKVLTSVTGVLSHPPTNVTSYACGDCQCLFRFFILLR